MYKISRPADISKRNTTILPITSIRRSCHLIPQFPRVKKVCDTEAAAWTSDAVLEQCHTFFINNFVDLNSFQTIY